MSKNVTITAFRYNELSDKVREHLRTRDGDRQGEIVMDVSERLTGMLGELTGTSVSTPSDRHSGMLQLEWSLSYSQGDGVAFYGRIDAEDMLAALTKEDRSQGWIDEETLAKIGNVSAAVGVLRTLRNGVIDSTRNSSGHHYSHYNTMQFDCYIGDPGSNWFIEPVGTWPAGEVPEPRGPYDDEIAASEAMDELGLDDEIFKLVERDEEELLTVDQEAPLVEFFRNISRFLEREGYEFLEALDEDTEWERFYAGGWFEADGHFIEWDDDEAREDHMNEIEERQAKEYKAAHPDEFPWVISDSKGVKPGEQIPIINRLRTHNEAAAWISTLPEYETGRYNLDGPSDDEEDNQQ